MYSIEHNINKETWSDFVDRAEPSTFLHDYAWGQVEEDMGKKTYHLGVRAKQADGGVDGNELVLVCLVSVVRARRGDFLLCPHGPVFKKGISSENFAHALSVLKTELVNIARAEHCAFVRMSPITLSTPESEGAFRALGFREAPIHVYSELSWILDVSLSEDAILSGMRKNTRYGIRKAERDGITVRTSADAGDIETFWNVYEATAKRQDFVPYTKKSLASEFARFGSEGRALWFFAEYKGEVVSTAMIIFSKHSAFYHHGASLHSHSAITPSELLQWHVIQEAKRRGCRFYNFWGVVPETDSAHPWAGLSNFKKGFGGYAEKYIHAKDYPLSWKYVITYLIETIRRWKRRV